MARPSGKSSGGDGCSQASHHNATAKQRRLLSSAIWNVPLTPEPPFLRFTASRRIREASGPRHLDATLNRAIAWALINPELCAFSNAAAELHRRNRQLIDSSSGAMRRIRPSVLQMDDGPHLVKTIAHLAGYPGGARRRARCRLVRQELTSPRHRAPGSLGRLSAVW